MKFSQSSFKTEEKLNYRKKDFCDSYSMTHRNLFLLRLFLLFLLRLFLLFFLLCFFFLLIPLLRFRFLVLPLCRFLFHYLLLFFFLLHTHLLDTTTIATAPSISSNKGINAPYSVLPSSHLFKSSFFSNNILVCF